MGMVVQHNMNAINSYNKLNANVAGMKKSSEKLSSGYRINRAGDDAAGLAVSEKMRSQIKGLNQAIRNSQDGINMIQTYEGAAQETHSILQRMKELASQSANGTYDNSTDRAAIQLEFDQLNDELNQIADTDFNGTVALNGGVMADGTKAVGSKIDYTAGITDVKELTNNDVVIGKSKYAGTNTETVTFTATKATDGTVTWKAGAGALGTVTNAAEGGFSYDGAVFAFDTDNVNTGDFITVDFSKKTAAVAASVPAALGYTNSNSKTVSSLGDLTAGAAATPASEAGRDDINALNGATIAYETDADGKVTKATVTLKDGTTFNSTDNAAATGIKDKYGIAVANGKITVSRWDADATTPKSDTVFEIAAGTPKKADAASQKGELTIAFSDAKFANEIAGDVKVLAAKVSQADSYDNSTAQMTYSDSITLQTGARTKDSVNFSFKYNADETADMGELKANLNLSARADGLNTENLSLATQKDANYAIDQIDKAINKTSMVRATFGSIQNRLEHKITNLTTTSENLTEAESSIRDTDMASEMMNYTKFNILQQAAQSMLAQANQQPQSILQLLG